MEKIRRFNMKITEEMFEIVQSFAWTDKISMAEWIRQAIEDKIEKDQKK